MGNLGLAKVLFLMKILQTKVLYVSITLKKMNKLSNYRGFTCINVVAHVKFDCEFIFPGLLNYEHYLNEREPIY